MQTTAEMIARMRAGEVSSAELVGQALDRAEAQRTSVNSVVVRDADRAGQAAQEADARRRRGEDLPLLGVPVTVKEAFDVAGLPTTWGLQGFDRPADRDAVVVERLKAAGAVIIGKTNVATMLADWQCTNPVYGRTNHPHDPSRTSGGSSGGAAAVASAVVPLDIGSDLNGSLRVPAAFCGAFAHRPSHALIPMRGFAPPMAPRTSVSPPIDLATVGPIAASAADLDLALRVLAGPDDPEASAFTLRLPSPGKARLRDWRILLLVEHPTIATDAPVRSTMSRIAELLAREGCVFSEESRLFPDLADNGRILGSLLEGLFSADLSEEEYEQAVKDGADHSGLAMSHRDWIHLDRRRNAIAEQWGGLFARFDLVVCPATPVTAFKHDDRPFAKRTICINGVEEAYQSLASWCAVPTPAGLPATVVPIGEDGMGLPVAAQVIGPKYHDRNCIAFAEQLSNALTG